MYILGLSAFYHDSAACLIRDGYIVAAAQEERFSRKKHDSRFPSKAINYCLREANIEINDINYIAFYDKPLLKFQRILKTYLHFVPRGADTFSQAMSEWFGCKLFMRQILVDELGFEGEILFPEHHESHAMSAFYPSPFQDAAFLTLDGVGEWATTSYGVGRGNELQILADIRFPHSIGLLYSAFTAYTGFKVNSGEYKVMGLAPYGEPKFKKLIYDHLIDVKDDGSFNLNLDYFDFAVGHKMTNEKFHVLFGGGVRKSESPITQRVMDLARSIQEVTEEIVIKISRHVKETTGMKNLCLSGGVALNCVSNGKVLREGIFDSVWVQPAAGDAGGALGAAFGVWYKFLGNSRVADGENDLMQGAYLGPQFSDLEIKDFLDKQNIRYHQLSQQDLPDNVADLIANGNVIGWFQNRMEFGPRALGARSIIGDARSPKMQEKMNLKIKFRESFRPFAPSVLEDKISEWFELDVKSPYMLLVANINKSEQKPMSKHKDVLSGLEKMHALRSSIPAVTHVDYSARIQSVSRKTNQLYYDLIKAFDNKYNCAVIVNSSFNVRGEPIVCTPDDAYRCFMRTGMDYLVIGSFLIDKTEQSMFENDSNWREEYELD